jgi:8-oxo-dGTP pyrophosphatase MutT (NUDIX family)
MNPPPGRHVEAARLRRAVRTLDRPPGAPGWNAAALADLVDPAVPRRLAAVLVPLVCRDSGLTVLFTERTASLRQHAGEVSFPGGAIESDDADAVAAALRETEEETGIDPASVDVFGYLDSFDTISGYCVTPVTGFVPADHAARPDGIEVAGLFEVPLAVIVAPGCLRARHLPLRGRQRDVLEFDWQGHRIWGATAAMLSNLVQRLADAA